MVRTRKASPDNFGSTRLRKPGSGKFHTVTSGITSDELPQETQIALKKEAQTVYAATQHGQTIRTKTSGKPGVPFRVDTGDAQYIRWTMPHPGNFQPTAFQSAAHECDIDFGVKAR